MLADDFNSLIVMAEVRGRGARRGPARDQGARYRSDDVVVGDVIVPLDVVEVHRVGDPVVLIEVLEVPEEIRVVHDTPDVALEVAVVDGVESNHGHEQAASPFPRCVSRTGNAGWRGVSRTGRGRRTRCSRPLRRPL